MNTTVDESGHGEGETYIGYIDLTHPGNGKQNFKGSLNANQTVPENANIALTLTERKGDAAFGASSEYSGVNNGGLSVCTDLLANPNAPLPNIILDENSPSITYLEANDENGDPISYTISSAADGPMFIIKPAAPGALFDCLTIEFIGGGGDDIIETRALSMNKIVTPPAGDYESPVDSGADNIYDFMLTATDINGASVTKPLSVTVTDVNEKPRITSNTQLTHTERQPVDMLIIDVESWDPDADDAEGSGIKYSLGGGVDAQKFQIDTATGELYFTESPDYNSPRDSNSDNVYEVQVRVTDDQGYATKQLFKVTVVDDPEKNGVSLQVKAILQGAYDSATGLMRDDLRSAGILPVTQPYNKAPFDYEGAESINLDLVDMANEDAMVDWVMLELRNGNNASEVVASKALLVQRDGDLMDAATGSTTIDFTDLPSGDYFIGLRHRNHLGVSTASAVTLSGNSGIVDFSSPNTSVNGDNARLTVTTTANQDTTDVPQPLSLLWSGDINQDQRIILNGVGSDLGKVLAAVLTDEDNAQISTSYQLTGYLDTDLNMDGVTRFTGPGNDVSNLLGNILLHPANDALISNFIIVGGEFADK